MKKLLLLCLAALTAMGAQAKKEKVQEVDSLGNKIKTGWNFGLLPSVAYDADCGFQGGLLTNIYYYGDGKQYPEYIHSLYFEAAYTTKNNGIFRFNYDSKYLIPRHRITIDATYLPDAMCDFYGYNGYQSVYNKDYHFTKYMKNEAGEKVYNPDKMNVADYRTRAFYKYKRDLVRLAVDFEGTIYKNLKWNAGAGVLGYICDTVHTSTLNGKKTGDRALPYNSVEPGLYQKYQDWGIMSADEARGGWHPYLRGGISFDTRDQRQGPNKGIYADAFFTYSAAFNSEHYGQQAAAGYNHLQFNATFRHYVTVYPKWVTFAYRLGIQNTIAGKSPFYMNTYLNTQFIQRVIYEGLGGANSLRGIMRNRVLSNGVAYANVEFRCKIAKFDIGRQHFYIGLNPFFDLGMVTQPYDMDALVEENTGGKYHSVCEAVTGKPSSYSGTEIDDNPALYFKLNDTGALDSRSLYLPHMSAGCGLKVAMNENFCVSVDWAKAINSQDGYKWTNFYIKMGYLF